MKKADSFSSERDNLDTKICVTTKKRKSTLKISTKTNNNILICTSYILMFQLTKTGSDLQDLL